MRCGGLLGAYGLLWGTQGRLPATQGSAPPESLPARAADGERGAFFPEGNFISRPDPTRCVRRAESTC